MCRKSGGVCRKSAGPPLPPLGSGNAAVLTPEDLGSGKAAFFDVSKINYFGPAGPNFAYVSLCFHLWAPAADKLQFQKNACSGAARTALILSEGGSDALSCFVAGCF